MARQLFNFRNVPDDEANDVRALLDEHAVDYYETPPSRWGISMGAIWLSSNDDYARARRLLDDYQVRRAQSARADYESRKARGDIETFVSALRSRPGEMVLYLLGAVGIFGVMMWPIWLLMD